jgi:adenylate cyclase
LRTGWYPDTVGHVALAAFPHAFVFADLVGFTALTAAHGDERGAEIATRFHTAVRDLVRREAESAEVKTFGDGLMVRAADPAGAIGLGVAIAETVSGLGDVPPVRVGVHAGPAVHRDGDWYGTAVNVASRLCDAAGAGEVLVSEDAAAAAGTPRGVGFGARRMHRLKHLDEPVAALPAHLLPATPARRPARGLARLRAALLPLVPCPAGDRIQGAH